MKLKPLISLAQSKREAGEVNGVFPPVFRLKSAGALMCLETFWLNHRWHLLFPHSTRDLSKN